MAIFFGFESWWSEKDEIAIIYLYFEISIGIYLMILSISGYSKD